MISLGENELNFGTAYELKEIQAPEGYEKSDEVFRFMLLDGSQCEKAMPAGFEKNAQIFYTSGVLYVPNRKLIHNRQTISVNKKWLASNGKPATPAADSIAINLYQTLSDGTRSIVKQNLVLNKANGWSIQVDDLPVYQMETIDGSEQPDGQKKISYSIEETTKSDQWESKVEHDGQNFTLTNTIKSKPIALPHTGSSNLGLLAGASAALILTGTLIETRNRKNRNKRV